MKDIGRQRSQWYGYSAVIVKVERDIPRLLDLGLLAQDAEKYQLTRAGMERLQASMAKREAKIVHEWYGTCQPMMEKLYDDIIPILSGSSSSPSVGTLSLYNSLSPGHAALLAMVFDQQVREAERKKSPFRFMNVGCGMGGVTDLLQKRRSFLLFEGKKTCYLAERDPFLVERMKAKYLETPDTEVMLAEAETRWPIGLQFVMAIDMLRFILSGEDKAAFILRLFDCLAPGGALFFNMGCSVFLPRERFEGGILPIEHPASPLAIVMQEIKDLLDVRVTLYSENYWERWTKFDSDFSGTPPSEIKALEASRRQVTQMMNKKKKPGMTGGRWAVLIQKGSYPSEPEVPV
jgi:hypothetical protein